MSDQPKIRVVRPRRPAEKPRVVRPTPAPAPHADYRQQAHKALGDVENEARRRASGYVDAQLRKYGLDPDTAKELVLKGIALIQAAQERYSEPDDDWWDDAEYDDAEYDDDDE